MPVVTLTNDPIMNALFGGVVMGTGIGFALRNNISSGGTDIVSLTIRKRTGKNVGKISLIVNGTIMLIAGMTFGWKYALYSMITIFVSSRVTDAVFTKQKRMQAMNWKSSGTVQSAPRIKPRLPASATKRRVSCSIVARSPL